jgi:hypothetical protein
MATDNAPPSYQEIKISSNISYTPLPSSQSYSTKQPTDSFVLPPGDSTQPTSYQNAFQPTSDEDEDEETDDCCQLCLECTGCCAITMGFFQCCCLLAGCLTNLK